MNSERDTIQTYVTAIVNEKAHEYGDTVSFCDLRWGINTEDLREYEANRKVLDVCLDEINRSDPPFIVLLGYRYGWIPAMCGDGALVAEAADRMHFSLEELEISITELEIQFGALSLRGKRMPVLVYFREIDTEVALPEVFLCESEEHKRKLIKLKKRIIDLLGSSVKTYHLRWNGRGFEEDDLQRFARMVADDVIRLLLPRWNNRSNLNALDCMLLSHYTFMQEKGSLLCVREQLVERFVNAFAKPEAKTFVVHGKPGVGKSTLASALALRLMNRGIKPTLFIECGLTSATSTWEGVYEISAMYIERLLARMGVSERQEGINRKAPRIRLEHMCRLAQASGLRVALVLDGVDQLSDSDSFETLEAALSITTNLVSVFVTSLSNEWSSIDGSVMLTELSDEVQIQKVIGTMEQKRSHMISYAAKQAIIHKTEAHNPLYLSLVVQRLLLMHRPDFERIYHDGGTMEAVARQELRLVQTCPHTLNEMALELLLEAGRRINAAATTRAIQYIAMSRYGMRPTDLETLCPDVWSPLDFAHLMHYLQETFLIRDDGRIDFAHHCVRDAVFQSQTWRTWCNRQSVIARYLWSLPEGDSIRKGELAYHCLEGSEYQRLAALIKQSMIDHDSEQLKEIARSFAVRCRYEVRNGLCSGSQDRISAFTSRFGSAVERYRGTDSERAPIAVEEALRWTIDPQPNDVLLVSFFSNEVSLSFGISRLDTAAFCHMIFNVRRMAVEIVDECKTYDSFIHALEVESVASGAVYRAVLIGIMEKSSLDTTLSEIIDFINYSESVSDNLCTNTAVDDDEKTVKYAALVSGKCLLTTWASRLISLRRNEGDYGIGISMMENVTEECESQMKALSDEATDSLVSISKSLMLAYGEQASLIMTFNDTERNAYGVECLKRARILYDFLSENSVERDMIMESRRIDMLYDIIVSVYLQLEPYYESDAREIDLVLLDNLYLLVDYATLEFENLVKNEGTWRSRMGLAECYKLRANILYYRILQLHDGSTAERMISDQKRALSISRILYSDSKTTFYRVLLVVNLIQLSWYYRFLGGDEAIEYSERLFEESEMIGVSVIDLSDEYTKSLYSQYLYLRAQYTEFCKTRHFKRRKTIEEFANTFVLTDEDDNEIKFDFIDLIEFDGEEYVMLLPNEEPEDDGGVVILKVEDIDSSGIESYVSIDNGYTLNKVFGLIKERLADKFNFVD